VSDVIDGQIERIVNDESGLAYWEDKVASMHMEITSIEVNILHRSPTSCELRRLGKLVWRKAKNNPYLCRELGLPER
jgi:hypothetical protein